MLIAPDDAGLGRLHRVELIMHGRRRAGEIVDLIDLDIQWKGDVVAHQLEVGMIEQRRDIGAGAGEEIVDAEHVMPALDQPGAEVRADEAGTPGDQNPLLNGIARGALGLQHWRLLFYFWRRLQPGA